MTERTCDTCRSSSQRVCSGCRDKSGWQPDYETLDARVAELEAIIALATADCYACDGIDFPLKDMVKAGDHNCLLCPACAKEADGWLEAV